MGRPRKRNATILDLSVPVQSRSQVRSTVMGISNGSGKFKDQVIFDQVVSQSVLVASGRSSVRFARNKKYTSLSAGTVPMDVDYGGTRYGPVTNSGARRSLKFNAVPAGQHPVTAAQTLGPTEATQVPFYFR